MLVFIFVNGCVALFAAVVARFVDYLLLLLQNDVKLYLVVVAGWCV